MSDQEKTTQLVLPGLTRVPGHRHYAMTGTLDTVVLGLYKHLLFTPWATPRIRKPTAKWIRDELVNLTYGGYKSGIKPIAKSMKKLKLLS